MGICLNVSTTPILAMGRRQCLPFSVVQLKGKHFQKTHCRNGVVGTFGLCYLLIFKLMLFHQPYSLLWDLYHLVVRHGAFPSHHALLVVVVIQVVGAAWPPQPPQPPLAYASCALAVRGSYFERSFRVEHNGQNLKILSKTYLWQISILGSNNWKPRKNKGSFIYQL